MPGAANGGTGACKAATQASGILSKKPFRELKNKSSNPTRGTNTLMLNKKMISYPYGNFHGIYIRITSHISDILLFSYKEGQPIISVRFHDNSWSGLNISVRSSL